MKASGSRQQQQAAGLQRPALWSDQGSSPGLCNQGAALEDQPLPPLFPGETGGT